MGAPGDGEAQTRVKFLKAYSKVDRKKIWVALNQKAMEYCQLPGGVVELEQQEVANNTNQDEGAPELQPPGPDFQDFFDLWQESEEDLAGEETLGEEADALANIVKSIEVEISKYQTLSVLPILMSKTPKVFSDPLLWWKKNSFSSQSFQSLQENIFAFLLQRHQVKGFSAQHPFFWANSETGWTQNLLVEWFSSRRIMNGMKNSSRRQLKQIEVVWNWDATSREDGSASNGGGYLCAKELRGNNQKVQVGKMMWNGEYLCVKELNRTIKE